MGLFFDSSTRSSYSINDHGHSGHVTEEWYSDGSGIVDIEIDGQHIHQHYDTSGNLTDETVSDS